MVWTATPARSAMSCRLVAGLKAVRELAPDLAEVKAAFAVVREGSAAVDEIEVVDEL